MNDIGTQVGWGIGISIVGLCFLCCFYKYVHRPGGCMEERDNRV